MSIDDTSCGDEVHEAEDTLVDVRISLHKSRLHIIDEAQAECDLKSRIDVFWGAMTLFLWALSKVKQGKRIAAYDEATDRIEMVHIPAFAKFDTFGRREIAPKSHYSEVAVRPSWLKRLLKGA